MSEQSEQLNFLRERSEAAWNRLIDEVVEHMKSLPGRLSGDDSGLDDPWDEFKSQEQGQHSVFYHLYRDLIETKCAAVIADLSAGERDLLWAFSEERYEEDNWTCTSETDVEQALYSQLVQAVRGRAMNEPLDQYEGARNCDD